MLHYYCTLQFITLLQVVTLKYDTGLLKTNDFCSEYFWFLKIRKKLPYAVLELPRWIEYRGITAVLR